MNLLKKASPAFMKSSPNVTNKFQSNITIELKIRFSQPILTYILNYNAVIYC